MLTSFVGREIEIAELEKRLDEVRLLTLVGAPGIGKTRLALETSTRLTDRYPAGVCVVELASIADPSLTAQALATGLDVPDAPHRSAEDGVVERLAGDEMLLVLDNCEHLTDGVAALVARLLARCPSLRVLATSRTPLGLTGEQVWVVPPLDLAPATQLFHDRARLSAQATSVEDLGTVVERICQQLDGLPLAIELAAALTRMLSPHDILGRLDQSLPLLRSRSRDVGPRQQTMEATVGWSYAILGPDERRLFEQLSVFAGGFDLDAAQAVVPDVDVLGGLVALVDHSLVLVGTNVTGGTRYRLLEPVRQYAAARFAGCDEGADTRRRHAEHYLRLASRLDDELRSERARAALHRFKEDDGNFRAALDFARSQPDDLGLRLCTALARSWALRRRPNEGWEWFGDMLKVETADRRLRGSALERAARLAWLQQDGPTTRTLLVESLAIARELGDELQEARRLRGLAMVHMAQGDLDRAGRLLDECIATCRVHGDRDGLALALAFAAHGRYLAGEGEESEPYVREALDLGRGTDNLAPAALGMAAAVFGAITAGDMAKLRSYATDMASLREPDGFYEDSSWLWVGIVLASGEGRYRSAVRIGGAVDAMAKRAGVRFHFPERFTQHLRPWLERARAEVGPAELARLSAEGTRMTLDELIDEGLAAEDAEGPSALSPRETEVADLVAEGLTNVQIAERLYISNRTVDTHVAHIKAKLGLAHRVEVATWVLRRRHANDPAPSAGRSPHP